MSDRSRFRTALLTLAAGAAGSIVAGAGALLLLEAFSLVAEPLRIQLTPGMRYAVIGGALLGVVPAVTGAVLRARRPSTDFLHRR